MRCEAAGIDCGLVKHSTAMEESVKATWVTFVFLVIALPIAIGIRFVQVLPYPLGGGRVVSSPNKQYEAYASSLTDHSFFGGEKRYYEFIVKRVFRIAFVTW